ncbi:TrkH protein [Rhizoctonia solani]|uniref:TrkH protein n=1 Tax=Rhizoctonia solani TaxID=456999 RepID=A0A8H7IDZ7_9AGAM|nr:TrkH protein [Rhizoctonia solani]
MDRGSLGAVHVPPTFVRSTTVYLTIPPPGAHRQPYLQAHGVLSLTAWPTYCLIILPHRRLDRKNSSVSTCFVSLSKLAPPHEAATCYSRTWTTRLVTSHSTREPTRGYFLVNFFPSPKMAGGFRTTWKNFYKSLNFFRLHVLFFIFTPLISASILYAANGLYPISFIDALFNCVSAMTVTGLATIDLSQLTGFQQSILFVLMCIGNPVIISWFIVYTRRRFFRNKLSHIIAEELKRERQGGIIAAMRERTMSISRSLSRDHQAQVGGASPTDIHGKHCSRPGLLGRFANWAFPAASPGKSPSSTMSGAATPSSDRTKRKTGLAQRLRTDMIRRTEAEPQRKGKGRELSGQQFPEKGDQFNHGGEVHHVITGSSGSQTRYGGDNSSNPSLHRTNSLRSTEAERIADDDTSLAQTLAMPSRHSNGTIPTPHRPEYDMAPNPANLSPPVTDELHLGPLMESPSHIDDRDGILLHPDADRNMDIIEGDSEGLDRATRNQSFVQSRQIQAAPIRVNPSTIGEERLSPSQGREADLMSVSFSGHERHPSEAVTQREPGTGIGEFPRNQTIEFVNTPHVRGRATARRQSAGVNSERERARFRNFSLGGSSNAAPAGSDAEDTSSANIGVGTSSIGHGNYGRGRASSAARQRMGSVSTAYFPRTATGRSHGTTRMNPSAQLPSHQSGYGGFPMPHELIGQGIKRFFPRTMTITLVGRNSQFHDLTQEEQENSAVLSTEPWALFYGLFQCTTLVSNFSASWSLHLIRVCPNGPLSFVNSSIATFPHLFSAFQAVSAYTNTGMSLIDQSMVPFQTAYPMIIILFFMIVAGNTAFYFKARGKLSPNYPRFKSSLRFFIWLLSKVVGKRTHETLSFLLDHPRRCFIYLFPSHQTWFLLIVLVTMVLTDWISFMVLDIGNDVFESIPVGTRIALGLLQAGAVRAAGFASVSISALAPAVNPLCYNDVRCVYPIALSVRATNVYEEQSLGIYLDGDEEEPNNPSNAYSWGSYLAWHARRQLSFGPSIVQPLRLGRN